MSKRKSAQSKKCPSFARIADALPCHSVCNSCQSKAIDSDVLGQVRCKPLSVQNEAQREKEKDFLESIWSAAAAAGAADELTGAATNHPHKIYLAPTSAKSVAYLDTIFLLS